MKFSGLLAVGLALPVMVFAASPFDGTWRPDPQKPEPGQAPDSYSLLGGMYQCQSCKPPYKVKADGKDHPVTGDPRFDTFNIATVDDHTIRKIVKKDGAKAAESVVTVSTDGNQLIEKQTVYAMGPNPFELTIKRTRVSAGPVGAHSVSGKWQETETDLTNHDEDTTLKVSGELATMTDKMGRSFTAKIDGTDAPYKGSDEFDTVSVKLSNAQTLEETDKRGKDVVKITRWTVDPDGMTMHARFDDTHGHIQEQTGHKLP